MRGAAAVAPAAWVPLDLTDQSSCVVLANQKFDYVFNLGGYIDHTPYLQGGRKVLEQHLVGVWNLVDVLDRSVLKGFVQAGTGDEYGHLPVPHQEDRVDRPISTYAYAKQSAGAFVQMLAQREGFPGSVVRLFLVYGPEQEEVRFLPQIISACLRGEHFAVTPGEQIRDFCYVDDVVEALVRTALSPGARGTVLNIGSGQPTTVREVVQLVTQLAGAGIPEFGARPYRAGESMALAPDVRCAAAVLGWRAETPLEKGLAQTIAYYREHLS